MNKPPKYTYEQIDNLTQAEARKTITHGDCMLIAYLDWCEGCYSKPDKRHRRFEDPFSITFLKFNGSCYSKDSLDNYSYYRNMEMSDTSLFDFVRKHFDDIKFSPILKIKTSTTFDANGEIYIIKVQTISSSDGQIHRVSIFKWHDSISYEYMLPVSDNIISANGYRYRYFKLLQEKL